LGDGEINVFWRRVAVSLGERHSENVQATSDAVNDDAGLGIDDVGYGFHIAEAQKFLGRVQIDIGKDFIRAAVVPSVDLPLQDWEIGYGPIDSGLCV
jgi:hypothetical protein